MYGFSLFRLHLETILRKTHNSCNIKNMTNIWQITIISTVTIRSRDNCHNIKHIPDKLLLIPIMSHHYSVDMLVLLPIQIPVIQTFALFIEQLTIVEISFSLFVSGIYIWILFVKTTHNNTSFLLFIGLIKCL